MGLGGMSIDVKERLVSALKDEKRLVIGTFDRCRIILCRLLSNGLHTKRIRRFEMLNGTELSRFALMACARIMEDYWQKGREAGLDAALIVKRVKPDGGMQIKILRPNQLLAGDQFEVYSLRFGDVQDAGLLAAINAKLFVRPARIPADKLWIHPDEQASIIAGSKCLPPSAIIKPAEPECLLQDSTLAAPKDHPPIAPQTVTPSAPKTSSLPTKTTTKTVTNKAAPKKSKLGSTTKTKTKAMDLKSQLTSDLYTTDVNEHKSPVQMKAVDPSDEEDVDMVQEPRQSFVSFSSDGEHAMDDGMANGPTDDPHRMLAASPMEIDSRVESPSTIGPKMKMIKVPRTFMENGYLSNTGVLYLICYCSDRDGD